VQVEEDKKFIIPNAGCLLNIWLGVGLKKDIYYI
jgi:hypothetical protein